MMIGGRWATAGGTHWSLEGPKRGDTGCGRVYIQMHVYLHANR